MRDFFVILGILAVASAAPTGSGPVKISDNNIENIFNININIQGVFSNNIDQDIVNVVAALFNQQGEMSLDGGSLKDKLLALAKSSDSKDVDINIPVSSSGPSFDFTGLGEKIKDVISKQQEGLKKEPESSESDSSEQSEELLQDDIAKNFKFNL